MPAVSVIVPVYCAQHTLDACVEALLAQHFADFELLLVDDGSTDESGALCDAWAMRDARIRALHQKNGGVQSAVLLGVQSASAPFCAFVDSDDTVTPSFLASMLDAEQRTGADIVCCGYADVLPDGTQKTAWSRLQEQCFFKADIRAALDSFFAQEADLTSFCAAARWNKLYKTKLLRAIAPKLDPAQALGEDMIMNLYALAQCKTLTIVPDVSYCYMVQAGSATRSMSMQKYNQYHRMMELLLQVANDMKKPAPALQKRRDSLYAVLILQTLMSRLSFAEKRQVVCVLRRDIANVKALRAFAQTQPLHGRMALQSIALGVVTPAVAAVNCLQAFRVRRKIVP